MRQVVSNVAATNKHAPPIRLEIGGWLSLIAVGLVLGPLIGVANLLADYAMLSMVTKNDYPGLDTLIVADVAILGALITFQVVVAVLFFRRHEWVPRLMVAWLSSNLGASVLLFCWTKEVFGEWPAAVEWFGRPIGMAAIWIPYFLLSRRVKLTFGGPISVASKNQETTLDRVGSVRSNATPGAKEMTQGDGRLENEIYLLTDADTVAESQTKRRDPLDDLMTDDDLLGEGRTPKMRSRATSNHVEKQQAEQGRVGPLVAAGLLTLALGLVLGIVSGKLVGGKPSDSQTRSIAPYGTWPPSGEKPSQDSLTSAVNRQVDRLQKDSNVQLRPDRAKRATAFSFYQIGIETARRAYDLSSSLDGLESDRLAKTAIEQFNRAVEVDPTFSAPVIALACIELYDGNDHDRAKQMLNQVINREPANAEAHYHLADVYYDDDDDVQALLSIERAVNFDPNFAPAYALRAAIHQNRRETSKANADRQVFVNLAGSEDRDNKGGIYPWTIRSILFQSKKTGLTLRYSSIWYPFDSVAKGTELRLIRNSDRKNVAISFINLADDVTADGGPLDLLNHVVKEIEDEQRNLSADSDFSASRASMGQIGDHRIAWTDMKTTKPAALSQRSRVFLLKRREQAWLIRFSVPAGDESFFQQHLPSAEDVIRSVSFRDALPNIRH